MLSSYNFDGKSTKSSNAGPSKRRISWSPTPGEGEEEEYVEESEEGESTPEQVIVPRRFSSKGKGFIKKGNKKPSKKASLRSVLFIQLEIS